MSRTRLRLAALALTTLGIAAPAAPALAAAPVSAEGACTAASDWKLTANPNDGFLQVTYEVDSDIEGQVWQYRLIDNGTVFLSGSIQTRGGGSFDIDAQYFDLAGIDRVVGQARNAATGEICNGRVIVRP